MTFLFQRKSFPFLEKALLNITNVALLSSKVYSMELALEDSFSNVLLCKTATVAEKERSSSFSELSSTGEMFDTKHKKIDGKPQVGIQHNQPDDSLLKHESLIESPTVKKSKLNESRQNLQLFLKSTPSKVNLTKKGIRSVTDTLQRLLSMRQDCSILQARGILKLTKGLITLTTDFENFVQLDEQNEDKIVTKRHHESAPSNIFSNEFVNKATLDQIAKGYPTVDNNDVNQLSMIWQVQDSGYNRDSMAPFEIKPSPYVTTLQQLCDDEKFLCVRVNHGIDGDRLNYLRQDGEQ
ncbi:hypothetical protein RFI_36525 [Reticulomyxa filosa]|uniref:Uncharacterized protein n=1 Tax=Reticulomyxa filosa TaxID=46433 RepID=X6LHV1_RETFI|nr:hypothetical protein RFI_36525 [Reticulomyxa filosa]|eukprot:ETO00916.1 hypothetical protein RFI_36525 [Reticulomyxa filosa]